jgi:hypothetical protein
MRRIALSLIAIAVILLTVAGSAATLGLASTGIGAGQAAVASCGDTTSVQRTYTTALGAATAINLTGFPATCNGGQSEVTITDAAGAVVASGGPAAIAGGAVSLSLSPQPNVSQVRTAHIVVRGP